MAAHKVSAHGSTNGRQANRLGADTGGRRGRRETSGSGINVLQVGGSSGRCGETVINRVLSAENIVDQVPVIGHGLGRTRRIDDDISQDFISGIPRDGDGMGWCGEDAVGKREGTSNARCANKPTSTCPRAVFLCLQLPIAERGCICVQKNGKRRCYGKHTRIS